MTKSQIGLPLTSPESSPQDRGGNTWTRVTLSVLIVIFTGGAMRLAKEPGEKKGDREAVEDIIRDTIGCVLIVGDMPRLQDRIGIRCHVSTGAGRLPCMAQAGIPGAVARVSRRLDIDRSGPVYWRCGCLSWR